MSGTSCSRTRLIAACSPAYLKRRPPFSAPVDLLNERLIHLENVDPALGGLDLLVQRTSGIT